MKKIFFFLFSVAAVSCKNDSDKVQPAPDQLAGTTWTKYYYDFPDGRKLYKVLRFVNDKQVKINFLIDKNDIYASVGFVDYMKNGNMFWVLNSDNTRTDGFVFPDRVEFNTEVYVKEN